MSLITKFDTKAKTSGLPANIVNLLNNSLPDDVKAWFTSNMSLATQLLKIAFGD